MPTLKPFVPPPYPYERIDRFKPLGERFEGGLIDLSIGTPCDPPPASVIAALSSSDSERGYPPSIGSAALRQSVSAWIRRRFDLDVAAEHVAACIGTKEFVGTLPQWLRLRRPDRDTILFPAIAYPTYEMGAILAGCRPVAVPLTAAGGLDLRAIDAADAERALALWVNSPGNPTGAIDDLAAAAAWGRAHDVPVFSDECYVEFTWTGRGRTILEHGLDGLVAVHSLSKRSNLAGARIGFYAGDPDLVEYLREVRKHVGMMVPGPVQAAGGGRPRRRRPRRGAARRYSATAGADGGSCSVAGRGSRCRSRRVASTSGSRSTTPGSSPSDSCASRERWSSPGDFYGEAGADHVRIAVVQPDDRIDLVARRLGIGI